MYSFRTPRGYKPYTRILAGLIIFFFLSNELSRSVVFANPITSSSSITDEENKVEFQTSLLTSQNTGSLPLPQPAVTSDILYNPTPSIQLNNLPLSELNFEQREQNSQSYPYEEYDPVNHKKTIFVGPDEKLVYEELAAGEFRLNERYNGQQHAVYRFSDGKLTIALEGQSTEYREEFVYQWDDLCQGANCQISSAKEKINKDEHFDVNINFSTGWNIFSNPFAETISLNSPTASFMESVWAWDNAAKKYVRVNEALEPGKVYWVWVDVAGERKFQGRKVSNINQQLCTGWNLIGSSYDSPRLENVIDTAQVTGPLWDWKDGRYKADTINESLIFPAGKGFWINVRQPTELKLAQPIDLEYLRPLDHMAPTGTIELNNGSDDTNTNEVSLSLNAEDAGTGVSLMRFSVDGGTSWSEWETYASSKTLTLPGGDGPKEVRGELQDFAGNVLELIKDTIVLDTTGPVVTELVGPGQTNASEIILNWTAVDSLSPVNLYRYQFRKPDGSLSEWIEQATNQVTFNAQVALEGVYTFAVQAQDAFGNWSEKREHHFTIDRTGPTGTIAAVFTAAGSGSFHLTMEDAISGVDQRRYSTDGGVTWSEWEAFTSKMDLNFPAVNGTSELLLQIRDRVGNVSAFVTPVIEILSEIPQITNTSTLRVEYRIKEKLQRGKKILIWLWGPIS